MQSEVNDQLIALLEKMWCEHRAYIKYLLVGLTHDLNLADDLLQDTYLNARRGIAGYAGGHSRAWLAQIARRVYFSNRRLRYVRSEEPLDTVAEESSADDIGSPEHLRLIEVRRAVAELNPSLRAALIMKHYGGLTYNEIAERQGCPVGTVKWRISAAIRQMRAVLASTEEESSEMECKKVSGTMLVDYVYQLLSPEDARKVQSHLAGCASCREEAETIRAVASALDAFEQEDKSQVFYELDEDGVSVVYSFSSLPNKTGKPVDVIRYFDTGPGVRPNMPIHASARGEALDVKVESVKDNEVVYASELIHPIQPGEHRDLLVVRRNEQSSPQFAQLNAQLVDPKQGLWLFRPGLIVKDPGEVSVRVEAVRLPPKAKLLSCSPEPDEVRANETTTLTWRRVLSDWEMFGLVILYQLDRE